MSNFQISHKIPAAEFEKSIDLFFKNAGALKLEPEEYFNELDFCMLELSREPDEWSRADWEAFRDAMQYDSEVIFMKRNNL